jgi:hypothetical protein
MNVEFNQGVPQECINWLWENVGQGNVQPNMTGPLRTYPPCDNDAWFYERVFVPNPGTFCGEGKSVPTITVKDEKLGMLFKLSWS